MWRSCLVADADAMWESIFGDRSVSEGDFTEQVKKLYTQAFFANLLTICVSTE